MAAANVKKILVLGAGLVARPLVQYLLRPQNFRITVAEIDVDKAKDILEGHTRGEAKSLNINNREKLSKEIRNTDLVISLLPSSKHQEVAELCLEIGKHFFSTSYVKPPMQALDSKIKKKKLLFMNELGVDPGLDHMTAMKIFDEARRRKGKIISFRSYCGGLPAPEANDNPWGYKFSWSPIGVLMAGKNPFKYLKEGRDVAGPGEKLFYDKHILKIPGLGDYESYPNRDSTVYIDKYRLDYARTVYRGTLRNRGWCEIWEHMHKTGLLDTNIINEIKNVSYSKFMTKLIGKDNEKNIKSDLAKHVGVEEKHSLISCLEWLGLFSSKKIKRNASPIDITADLMQKKMSYKENERDMIILHHDIMAEFPKGLEHITSTLIDYGIPGEDSSMARTVGLPCAIAAKIFLDGKFNFTGVHIPLEKAVYEPLLEELEKENIKCIEKYEKM